jgi:lipid-binding SYLF domain-containing protein
MSPEERSHAETFPRCRLLALMMLGNLTWTHLTWAQAQETEEETYTVADLARRAAKVLEKQMTEKGNKRIPAILRQESKCVIAFPGLIKAAAIIGVKGAQGLGSCRQTETGEWSAPVPFNLSAGSVGLQAGIQVGSVLMLVTNQVGVNALLKGKVSLGTGIGLAAGPVGGTVDMSTQQAFLTYVRTMGLFAGVDLEGMVLTFAKAATEEIYGKKIGAQEILFGEHEIPDSVKIFHETLQQFAP